MAQVAPGTGRSRLTVAALLATGLAVTGCAPSQDSGGTDAQAAGWPTGDVRIMAPADAGGGWDQTSRALQEVMSGRVDVPVEVYNVGGAGGTVGIAQFVGNEGDPNELMTMGSIMVGAIETNASPVTLDQVTPLVRLLGEYEVIVAPTASPFQTIDDMVAAMQADVGSVAIAGGSAGGIEQILAGLVAQEIGADPGAVNYIPHSGGGEALATILSGRVQAGISGINEIREQIEAGQVRALAVSSPERIEGIDAPTLTEAGLDIELANWRGMVAPPGISAEEEQAIEDALTDLAESPEWQQVLADRGWDDQFLAGEEFEQFLDEEQERVRGVLEDLGLVSS
ncbi:tripartite tricarboxylate transporter substrate binding protein [Geodermatophilus sp. DSM 45219]|uniref:Bug family tripartite tricarboxylate transporter substrate binding protein n=1 Tax=Geodermatophilus sp. DSM 45219 TaxID=1881103 RepID=UPI00088629C6|nr:tripartite tricarboxylate transporter substrate-binding protein [Geodermatophilus sp. DSM 45219]SDO62292.1 putative tricarboxylic transport membrane protein [Geodermatophilus sp. DSM 45219]